MTRNIIASRLARSAGRSLQSRPPTSSIFSHRFCHLSRSVSAATLAFRPATSQAPFSTTARRGVPPPLDAETLKTAQPADLSDTQYHEIADHYMDVMVGKYEELMEKDMNVEVDYSQGVMTLTINGQHWVVNKQPPNKQLWLSSPISGPKRYDYVVFGEGQGSKQDTAMAGWVYLRDGSTLNELMSTETGVDIDDWAQGS